MRDQAVLADRPSEPSPVAHRPAIDARTGSAVLAAAVTACAVILAYRRRWVTDDAMIYVRAVRQILAGNGPTFNVQERTETSTGTLWQWLLAAVSWVSRVRPDLVAVYLGLLLFAAALSMSFLACRTLIVGRKDRSTWTIPFGALAIMALPPFWDFATSGLETSLVFFWIAACWWQLTRLCDASTAKATTWAAASMGLGPLVRPDMAIVSAVFLVSLVVVMPQRSWATIVRLGAAAVALPAAYEIFRMGYYGELVPLPGITKNATGSDWSRGVHYVADFARPYALIIPIALVCIAIASLRPPAGRSERNVRIIALAPVAAGILSAVYIMRVGGDFMHARMLLPAMWLILLPAFAVRLSRAGIAMASALAVWSAVCVLALRVPYAGVNTDGISNERGYYSTLLGGRPSGPRYAAAAGRAEPAHPSEDARLLTLGPFAPAGVPAVPLGPQFGYQSANVMFQLGINGAGMPLDDAAVDPLGLAYPLVAHMEPLPHGRPGHSKAITVEWLIADYGSPDAPPPPGVDPQRLDAARKALTCGPIKDLVEASREPMSFRRFVRNLISAPERSRLVIPRDPILAEQKFC